MQKLAKKHQMVMVVPIYEVEMPGVYYNTAAGNRCGRSLSGKISQAPHPALPSRILGKVLFHSGQCRISCFQNTLCASWRLHLLRPPFPGRRAHSRSERRRNCLQSVRHGSRSSPNICGNSSSPRNAVANAYLLPPSIAWVQRSPGKSASFTAKSYFCNPRGKIVAQASRDKDELLVADLNLDEIQQVRDTWQFYRDRRPESYSEITRTRAAESAAAAD